MLDEPTTGLDFVARHRFMESIRRLANDGTTLILVTHHVEEIVPEIKRVILLRAGKVAFNGKPEDALTPERLKEVFGAPMHVERSGGYYHVRLRRQRIDRDTRIDCASFWRVIPSTSQPHASTRFAPQTTAAR